MLHEHQEWMALPTPNCAMSCKANHHWISHWRDSLNTLATQNTVLTPLFSAPEFREALPTIIILLIYLANFDVREHHQNNFKFANVAVFASVFTAIQSLS